MSVLVRSKRGGVGFRQRRQGFAGRGRDVGTVERDDARATIEDSTVKDSRPAARRRELGPLQDQALYSCSCGFVFEAPVSTSVGCPHCGSAQAW